MTTAPEDLMYTENHEWIRVEDDICTVGISDHAQSEMGDIVYIELPEEGTTLEKGDELAVLESVKASEPVYSPVSGEVLEINEGLPDQAGDVNSDPYGAGWMVRIKMSDPSQIDDLMNSAAYLASL